jgi:hypothetical protein
MMHEMMKDARETVLVAVIVMAIAGIVRIAKFIRARSGNENQER